MGGVLAQKAINVVDRVHKVALSIPRSAHENCTVGGDRGERVLELIEKPVRALTWEAADDDLGFVVVTRVDVRIDIVGYGRLIGVGRGALVFHVEAWNDRLVAEE